MLASGENVPMLQTMLWPDEVRNPTSTSSHQDVDIRAQEPTMAGVTGGVARGDFDPDQYHDNYRETVARAGSAHEGPRRGGCRRG